MSEDLGDIVVRSTGLGKRYKMFTSTFARLRELWSPTRKRYSKDFWAVQDLDFTIKKGQVFGFIGKNGAGKSTTLKMLAGRLQPTTGDLDIVGRVSAILELGTGLQPSLTGRQNARVNALFMGLDPWRTESRLASILEFAELGDFADQPLENYSSGMKARLAFSVLTAMEPEILLLDEALATGDARFQAKCRHFIRGLCSSGATTIVVSHDLNFMVESCDELIWLDGGAARSRGNPERVVAEYLADQGQAVSFDDRPAYLIARLSADRPRRYLTQAAYFVGSDGKQAPSCSLGEEAQIANCNLAAGIPPTLATRGWGGCVRVEGEAVPFREVNIGVGAEGAVYLALPVPAAPSPMPVAVGIIGKHDGDVDIRLETLGPSGFEALPRLETGYTEAGFGADGFRAPAFNLDSVWKVQ